MKNIKKLSLVVITALALSIGALVLSPAKQASAQCVADAPTNLKTAASLKGSEKLTWDGGANTNRFVLVYGFSSNNYQFGALDVDGAPNPNYTIGFLNPGTKYFARIWAMCDNDGPATASNEVSFIAP